MSLRQVFLTCRGLCFRDRLLKSAENLFGKNELVFEWQKFFWISSQIDLRWMTEIDNRRVQFWQNGRKAGNL